MIREETDTKIYIPRESIFFKEYRYRKEILKPGVINKRIERLMYIIKDLKRLSRDIITQSQKGT